MMAPSSLFCRLTCMLQRLQVAPSIITFDEAEADRLLVVFEIWASNSSAAALALGLAVEAVSKPTLNQAVVGVTSPLPPPTPPPPHDDSLDESVILGVAVSAAVVVLILLLLACKLLKVPLFSFRCNSHLPHTPHTCPRNQPPTGVWFAHAFVLRVERLVCCVRETRGRPQKQAALPT